MKPIKALFHQFLLIIMLLAVNSAFATHISGGEIKYKNLSADTYELTVDVYYNCDRLGIIAPPTAGSVNSNSRIFSSCGTNLSRGFVSKGFVEVSQLCASSLSSSTCGTGSLPGLRKYTFVDTVVLAPRCTTWTIRFNSVNRDGSDNVFQATNRSLYIDCVLDNVVDSFNSSPIFNADPTPYFCGGTASTYNFNVSDPDGDSISLSLVPGRALIGSTVVGLQYTGIPNNPHNTNFGGANPLPNLSFSAATGSITFNPPNPPAFPANSSYSYVVVLEVRDYDSQGKLKTTTRRDMKFEVIRCSGNNIPVPMLGGVHNVTGGAKVDSNTVRVIKGDSITFDFSFVDSGDSITLTSIVNQTLGATFSSSTAKDTATGTIGWRPNTTSGSPFSFSIDALDDNCPVSGRNSATLLIEVIDSLKATSYTEQKQSCNNFADGKLTVNFTGGIGPYGYRWFKNGVLDGSLTTNTISGISSNDSYSVTVIDSFNNTTSSLGSTNIAQTNPISIATDTVTSIGCNQSCAGEINITSVVGGTPTVAGPSGYRYSWTGISDTTNNPTNLCSGRYFVTISDQNGCDTVYRFYVNGPAEFEAFIADSTNVLCKGDSTGRAEIGINITSCGITSDLCNSPTIDTVGTGSAQNSVSGFPAPYSGRRNAKQQYLIRASEIGAAGIPGDIKISSLAFLIRSDNFITESKNFEINIGCTSLDSLPPDTFISGLFNVFDSASISIPFAIATPTWKTHPFQNAFVWDGTSNIVVEVCWNNGFSPSQVHSFHALTNTSYRSSTYYSSNFGNACLADSIDGSANRRPNMRFGFCNPEMTYSWSTGGTDSLETNLWAATHTITVTNEESCKDTITVKIEEPATEIIAALESKVDVNCAGDSTGSARITVSGGTAPYTFNWPAGVDTGARDSIAINLTSSITYIVTVTDVNNCEDTAAFEIDVLSNVIVGITDSVSILCNGGNNGRLFATPDSGVAPYTYSWNRVPSGAVATGATDSIAINLSSGTYRVVVTDSVGCVDSADITLSEPQLLSSQFTDSTVIGCNGDTTGSLTVTPSGGTPGYNFNWFRLNGSVTTGTSDSIAINLPADTVGVIIIDANGCRDTNARIMSEPASFTASFTDSTKVSCVGGTNGSLTITPNGGSPKYSYTWSPTVTVGATDSIATGLSANIMYKVTITDANTCTAIDSFSLDNPNNPVQLAITDSVEIDCFEGSNGSLFATPTGGAPNYTFTWTRVGGGGAVTTGSADSIAINLNADTFRVIVQDLNGCRDSVDYSLSEPAELTSLFVDSIEIDCFGGTNGSLTVLPSGGTPRYGFSWSPAVTTGASDSIALNLSGNISYRAITTDSRGCADTIFKTLSEPSDLNSSFTDSTSVSCAGENDGSLTVTPNGGTPGYTFSWSPAVTAGASDSIALNLSGNTTYQVIIEDANGCRDTNSARLRDPSGITSVFTDSTSLSCPGDTNGSITVTPTGGSSTDYNYAWTASNGSTVATGSNDSIAINLTSGVTYTVIISDVNGCSDTVSRSLRAPTGGLTLNIAESTSINCFGGANGELIVTPSGGNPRFTYAWSRTSGAAVSTGATDSIAVSLSTDTFKVIVTDNSGCVDSVSYFLDEPSELTSSFTDSTNISCFGGTNGSLTITPAGGTPGYTYTWARLNGAVTTGTPDSIAINLPHDTVAVIVIDANGCRDTSARIISEPTELTSSFTDSTSVSCTALGSATITPSGGTPGYTYSWSPAVTTGATDSIATALNGATNYRVIITDNNSCPDTNFITLRDPVRPTAQFTDSISLNCPGDTNASLTVTPSGGVGPYSFSWTPAVTIGSSDSVAINLSSSILYTVVVTDFLGCKDTVSRTISVPSAVTASIFDSLSVACVGDTNARLFASASLGSSPYSYNWLRVGSATPVDTGVSDSVAISLGAGTYRVIVTDANGCKDSTEKILLNPDTLKASFTAQTPIVCGGSSTAGMFTVTPTGGRPNYTYAWTPAVTTGASDSIAINLSASILYTVLVTDTAGCTVSVSDSLTNPNNFKASFTSTTDPTCKGDANGQLIVTPNSGVQPITYNWSQGTSGATDSIRINLRAGQAIFVTVSDAAGCADTINTTLTDPPALLTSFTDSTSILCGGDTTGSLTVTPSNGSQVYGFNWSSGVATGASDSIAINLSGNVNYTVTTTDGDGCRDTISVTLFDPPAYSISFSDSSSILCNADTNGSLTVTPSVAGTYSYTWSASDGSTVTTAAADSIAINLKGGVLYRVTVEDSRGCQKVISKSLINPTALSFTTSSTPARCGQNQGTATINVTGGTPGLGYTFVWDSAGTSIGQTTQTATGLFAGLYNVEVTDANGCTVTASNINVNDFGAPAVTLDTLIDASCEGVCNGSILVSIRSFNGPVASTIWSNGATSEDITNLCDTVYSLEVTDSAGCRSFFTDTVNNSGAVSTNFNIKALSCLLAVCDAEVVVTATGGSNPYTYQWSTAINDTLDSIGGLCAGSYIVTVNDLNGCEAIDTAEVLNPTTITSTVSSDSVSCNGGSDGVARVNVLTGNAPLSYVWSTSVNDTLDSLAGIPVGTYFVTITSVDGCTAQDTVVISQPDSINATFTTVPADCGIANGRVTASPIGGNGIYTYSWPVGGVTNNPLDTAYLANSYNMTISDQKGCSKVLPFTISNVGGPVVTLDSIRHESCVGLCDGGIFVNVSAGSPGYLYQWSPGGSVNQDLDSVCSGDYTLRVRDQAGCITFYRDTINSATPIVVNASAVSMTSAVGVCDGQGATAATGGAGPYTYSWTGGSTSDTSMSLCGGVNFVTVTDSLGCSAIDTITIMEPSIIVIDSFNVIDPTCNAVPCDGQVFVLASGGLGPLTYTWTNGDAGQLTTGRCPGLATVTITDGVTTIMQSFPLSNINGPVVTKGKRDVLCNGDTTGLAFASTSDPTDTYFWPTIPSVNDSIFNLSASTYEVRVTDTSGCVTTDTIIVNEPSPITHTFATLAPNCGASDGEIRAVVSGGTPNYSYNWLDNSLAPLIPAQTADTAKNLPAGIYNLAIEDAKSCRDTIFNIGLNNLNAATITLDSLNNETCLAACDGDIYVSVTGGTGALGFAWTGGTTAEDLLVQCPSSYTLTVTDASGCVSFYTDTIEAADPIISNVVIVNNVSAVGFCDGGASALATGGSGSYTYQWTGGQTSASANNLCVGTSYVTITDLNGCSIVDSITLQNPAVLRLDTAFITNPACNVCNGEIVVVISGGTTPYTYTWDNGDNTDTSSNRCAGVVRLNVRDANGLSENFTFPLSNFPAPAISLSADSVSCFASCDGQAAVTVLNALPPYTVNWVGLSSSADTIRNLCAGVYGVEVTDVVGCIAADTIEVKSPAEISASFNVTDPNCQASDGSATAQVITVGGKTPYSFEWLDASQNSFTPAETNPTINNIAAGVYYLSITDANNCIKLENVNISNQGGPVIILDSLKNESCIAACDGEISLSTFGSGPLIFDWNQGAFATEDISALCSGNYIVEVTDAANCKSFDNYTILPADTFNLNINSISDASCDLTNDGAIDIDVFGASAPFQYTWSGPNNLSASLQDVVNLAAGDYKVLVSDVNGCEDSLFATVNVATQIEVFAPRDTAVCGNPGALFLRATSNSNAAVSYTWYDDLGFVEGNSDLIRLVPQSGIKSYVIEARAGLCLDYDTVEISFVPFVRADAGNDLVITKGDEVAIGGNPTALAGEIVKWSPDRYFIGETDEMNPLVKPDETINYIVEVETSVGCVASDTITVTVNPIKLVDGFTPNGDGVNDFWRLKYLDDFPNANVEVYNRWGQLVFRSSSYANPWDGKYKGQDLPVGTYYYVIDLNDDSVEERVLTGPVTIMR